MTSRFLGHHHTVGRTNTVLLVEDMAVVTSLCVQATETEGPAELCFKGPGIFKNRAAEHLSEVVLPLVDRILSGLGLSKKRFELSLTNLGAASFSSREITVAGYSADAPVFLALLSAGLGLALPQDLVSTGHIASPDGDIRMVEGLEAKLTAAVSDKNIETFVYPALDRDMSLPTLLPAGKARLEGAIGKAKANLRLAAVHDIQELIRFVFSDQRIVLAALESGFYRHETPHNDCGSTVEGALSFLHANHEARFWSALESHLLSGQRPEAERLLRSYARFHLERERYPEGMGSRLMQLVQSLPPDICRYQISFPILPMSDCLGLSRLATDRDHEDVRWLMKAAHGERSYSLASAKRPAVDSVTDSDPAEDLLDRILFKLDREAMTSLLRPIDEARATYQLGSTIVDAYEAFNQTVTAFYLHMLRHSRAYIGVIDGEFDASEAFALVDKAYAREGGYKGALAEARTGAHGGLRQVLDRMTEQYKQKEQEQHVLQTLRTMIDPDDWETRTKLVAALIKRWGGVLSPETQSPPPAQLAEHLDEMVMAYVTAQDRLKTFLSSK